MAAMIPRWLELLLSVGVTTATTTLDASIHLETGIESWKSSHISLSLLGLFT